MKWFRPAIASVLIGCAIVGFFMGKVTSDFFCGLVTGMAVWWYKERDQSRKIEVG